MKQLIAKWLCIALLLVSSNLNALPVSIGYFPPPVAEEKLRPEQRQVSLNRVRHLQRFLADKNGTIPITLLLSIQTPLNSLEKRLQSGRRSLPPYQLRKLAELEISLTEGILRYQQSQVDYTFARHSAIAGTVLSLSTLLNRREQGLQNQYLSPEAARLVDRGQIAGIFPSLSDVVTEQMVTGVFDTLAGSGGRKPEEVVDMPVMPTGPEPSPTPVSPVPTEPFPVFPSLQTVTEREALSLNLNYFQAGLGALEGDIARLSEERQKVGGQLEKLEGEVEALGKAANALRSQYGRTSQRVQTLAATPRSISDAELGTIVQGVLSPSEYAQFLKVDPAEQIEILQRRKTWLENRNSSLRKRIHGLNEEDYKQRNELENLAEEQKKVNLREIELELAVSEVSLREGELRESKQNIEHEIGITSGEMEKYSEDLGKCFQIKAEREEYYGQLTETAFKKKERLDFLNGWLASIEWDSKRPYRLVEGKTVWEDPETITKYEKEYSELTDYILTDLAPEVDVVRVELESATSRIETIRHEKAKVGNCETVYLDQLEKVKTELEQLNDNRSRLTAKATEVQKVASAISEQQVLVNQKLNKLSDDIQRQQELVAQNGQKQQGVTDVSLKLARDLEAENELTDLRKTLKQLAEQLDSCQSRLAEKDATRKEGSAASQKLLDMIHEKESQKEEIRQQMDTAQSRLRELSESDQADTRPAEPSLGDELNRRRSQDPPEEQEAAPQIASESLQPRVVTDSDETDQAESLRRLFETEPDRSSPEPEIDTGTTAGSHTESTPGWGSSAAEWMAVFHPLLLKSLVAWHGVKAFYYYNAGFYEELGGEKRILYAQSLLADLTQRTPFRIRKRPAVQECCERPDPVQIMINLAMKKEKKVVSGVYGQCPIEGISDIPPDDLDVFAFTPVPKPFEFHPEVGKSVITLPDGMESFGFTPASKPFDFPPLEATTPVIPPVIPEPLGFTPMPKSFDLPPLDGMTPVIPPVIPEPLGFTPVPKSFDLPPLDGMTPAIPPVVSEPPGFTPAPKLFDFPPLGGTTPVIPPEIPDPLGFTPVPEPFDFPSIPETTPVISPVMPEPPAQTLAAPEVFQNPEPAQLPPVVDEFTPALESVAAPDNYSGTTALIIHPEAEAAGPVAEPLTVDEVIDIIRPKSIIELRSYTGTTALAIRHDETKQYQSAAQPEVDQQSVPQQLSPDSEPETFQPEEAPPDEIPSTPVPEQVQIQPPEDRTADLFSQSEPVLPDFGGLARMQISPEFSLMTALSQLSGVVQMVSLSGIKNLSSRIWRTQPQERALKDWLQPELVSFAYSQGQLAPWDRMSGNFTFVQGFNQSGSFSSSTWGSSGFSWGTLGLVDTHFLAGVILSKQKIQVSDLQTANKLSFESNHLYSLGAWQRAGFEIAGILGAGWPDYRYQNGPVSDKFSGEQWLGYLAVSQRFSFSLWRMELGISPLVEYFTVQTSTSGHSVSGLPVNIASIDSSVAAQEMQQMGLVLDTDSRSGKQSQSWQAYLGWQTTRGKQGLSYRHPGHSDHLDTAESLDNMVYSLGATRRLAKNLSLQLTINGSYGDFGSHQGLNISYTQQF